MSDELIHKLMYLRYHPFMTEWDKLMSAYNHGVVVGNKEMRKLLLEEAEHGTNNQEG